MRHEFEAFLDQLAQRARSLPDIVGLVGFGSTADRSRADAWSDHDFAWVTEPGAQDRYRHDLSWLPAAEHIAVSVVEDHGGVKVIYSDGHVLEFGIASIADLDRWAGNCAEVIVDKGGVAGAIESLLARTRQASRYPAEDAIRLFLTQLLIGIGRARRGEVLSASVLVRAEAVNHLLLALTERRSRQASALDSLDPRRRFELVHPELAARIEAATRRSPDECARELLDIAEDTLAEGWAQFPHGGVRAVRRRLGWDTAES